MILDSQQYRDVIDDVQAGLLEIDTMLRIMIDLAECPDYQSDTYNKVITLAVMASREAEAKVNRLDSIYWYGSENANGGNDNAALDS